jgi:hypothetical protein
VQIVTPSGAVHFELQLAKPGTRLEEGETEVRLERALASPPLEISLDEASLGRELDRPLLACRGRRRNQQDEDDRAVRTHALRKP